MKKSKNVLYSIKAIGSRRVPVTPVTASQLYNSICIPKLLYGCEIMKLDENCCDKLEEFHSHAAKNLQGFPDHAANPASLATIGWSSMESMINMMRLMFLWRLLLLPMSCIYKVVLVRRIACILSDTGNTAIGPVSNMLKLCKKYQLYGVLINAIASGEYLSMLDWKRKVKAQIQLYDLRKWKVTCHLYRSLSYLNIDIVKFELSPWWHLSYENMQYSHQSRIILQLLVGKNRRLTGLCKLCNDMQITVEHILFECNALHYSRDLLWNDVKNVGLKGLIDDLNSLSSRDRTTMILNGFNVN